MTPLYEFSFQVIIELLGVNQLSHHVILIDTKQSQAFARMADLCIETQKLIKASKPKELIETDYHYRLLQFKEIGYINEKGEAFRI